MFWFARGLEIAACPAKLADSGGQDTVERHGGFDVVMEKIVLWKQKNPASNGSTISVSGGQGGGVGPTRHPKSPGGAQGWRVTSPPNAFLSEGGALGVVVEASPSLLAPSRPRSWEREEGSGGGDGGARGALPPVGVRRGRSPRQPQCITLGRLAPRHYAVRRRPRCPRLARRGGAACERGAGGGTVGRDRIATTPQCGSLSGPAIPVSPQAARPAVSERGIGAGGVRGVLVCQGVRKSSLPGKARGFRGVRTPWNAMTASVSSWRRSSNGSRKTRSPTAAK